MYCRLAEVVHDMQRGCTRLPTRVEIVLYCGSSRDTCPQAQPIVCAPGTCRVPSRAALVLPIRLILLHHLFKTAGSGTGRRYGPTGTTQPTPEVPTGCQHACGPMLLIAQHSILMGRRSRRLWRQAARGGPRAPRPGAAAAPAAGCWRSCDLWRLPRLPAAEQRCTPGLRSRCAPAPAPTNRHCGKLTGGRSWHCSHKRRRRLRLVVGHWGNQIQTLDLLSAGVRLSSDVGYIDVPNMARQLCSEASLDTMTVAKPTADRVSIHMGMLHAAAGTIARYTASSQIPWQLVYST